MDFSSKFYRLRKLHGIIHEFILSAKQKRKFYKENILPIRRIIRQNSNIAFLVLTPAHGNLGDHAIAVSESNLLKQLNIEYIEITGRQLTIFEHYNYLHIMDGHPIFINGGGNMGTLWFSAEKMHRAIIKKCANSPIFIMPNTIYYENSEHGECEFEKSIEIYNAHPNLHIFAREDTSYHIMKKAYKNVALIPDMVFALNECKPSVSRKGCLLCLRNDLEKTLSDFELDIIKQQVASIFGSNVSHTDMFVDDTVAISDRQHVLEQKYAEFRNAELVITDRLHGMVFCAITGTPCIVINSRSPKVRGCYKWISNLDYIKLADDPSTIVELFRSIPHRSHQYDNVHLVHYFDKLQSIISSTLQTNYH